MPIHIITAVIFIIAAYKWGDWRNWKSYYSTILFFDLGDLMYFFLFEEKMLWQWKSPFLSSTVIELLWLLFLFPCISLLFLPNFPIKKKLMNKVFYLAAWAAGFSVLEAIFHKFGYIVYENGWNVMSSVIFYCLMFPVLMINQYKPALAILISFIWAPATMIIFKVPIPNS
jgi:hypothetical protein